MTYPTTKSYGTIPIYHASIGPRFDQAYKSLLRRRVIVGKDPDKKSSKEKSVQPLTPTEECLFDILDAARLSIEQRICAVDFDDLYERKVDPGFRFGDELKEWQAAFNDAQAHALELFQPTDLG